MAFVRSRVSWNRRRPDRITVVGRAAVLAVALVLVGAGSASAQGSAYLRDLRTRGQDPVRFVLDQLDRHDLIVFDDGLHTMVEPFHFYERLVRTPGFRARAHFVFLEAVPLSQQRHLDEYLASDRPDSTLLFPAFQNDLGGEGFPYATYFHLLRTIYDVNRSVPDSDRIHVVAVGSASYWPEIRTARDLEVFRQSLGAYDYTMYTMISNVLNASGGKGIFLTNTRHAYEAVRRADGSLHWNTTTYFHERDPGRAYSIRIHAPQLVIERVRADTTGPRTTQGLERVAYHWSRMEDGAWDRAFAADGNAPVAVPMAGTAFGRAPYVGNEMLDAAPGQTMADAYDGLLFLAPVDSLHQTAMMGSIYTPQFRVELARRLRLLYDEHTLTERIAEAHATDLADYIATTYVAASEKPLPQAHQLPPLRPQRP